MNTETRLLPATYAAIVFSGKNFDPKIATEIIGKSPTLSYAQGSRYHIKNTARIRKASLWVYSTRNELKSDDLGRHLDCLEELLRGSAPAQPGHKLDKIHKFVKTQKIILRVDVFWYGARHAPLPIIPCSFDEVVTAAGGTVATDFHREGDAIEAA